MNETDRNNLLQKLRETWPEGGPSTRLWGEVFDSLDSGPAGTVLVRLRNEHDRCPSIAQFQREYRSLRTRTQVPVPGDVECEVGRCDGSGWTSHHEFIVRGRTYGGVRPCSCQAGERCRPTWQSIVGARARHPGPPPEPVPLDGIGPADRRLSRPDQ